MERHPLPKTPELQRCALPKGGSVQSLSRVPLFATSWTAAHKASLSITSSRSLLKLMSIESVMPSSLLILYHPLLLPPSIFPSIRVFSNESAVRIRWPKAWSLSLNISPSSEHSRLISIKQKIAGTSLAVPWLGRGTFSAQGPGSVPGQGTKIL